MTRWPITLILTAIFASTVAHGQADTTYTYFQDSLKFTDKITNGLIVYRTVYYLNGNKKEEGKFIGDFKKTGLWIEYYENGQKKSEGEYKNVLLFRKSTVFVASGGSAMKKRAKYLNRRHLYRDNIKNGKWTYWYSNGNPQEIDWIKKGRVTKRSMYDQNGQILLHNKKIKRKARSFDPSYNPQNNKALF